MYPPPIDEYNEAIDAVDEGAAAVPAADLCIGQHQYENLSGTAGTGKTYTAKALAQQSAPGSIIFAATTGIAAVNLGGEGIETTTINAALKYFDTKDLQERFLNRILHMMLRKHRRAGVQRLLIDEKSMMSGDQLTYITRALEAVNNKDVLEGVGASDDDAEAATNPDRYDGEYGSRDAEPDVDAPLAITLVGDFGQLPPVPDKNPITHRNEPVRFCFDSPEWARFAAHTTVLQKIWRQDNLDFINGLHAIRKADVRAALSYFDPGKFVEQTDDQYEGTTIFAKNDAVEDYNQLRLDRLTGPVMSAVATRTGKQRPDWKNIPDTLRLKEGALVMILANRRVYADEFDDKGKMIYANGDLGTLLSVDTGGTGWQVRLQRTGGVVRVLPIVRENTIPLEPGRRKQIKEAFAAGVGPDPTTVITDKGKGKSEIIGTVIYMPLRAAYGATVHKTQGLTLDKVQVNIRDSFFRQPHMLFVALSRARTIEGLRIVGNQAGFVERCRIDPRVIPWL